MTSDRPLAALDRTAHASFLTGISAFSIGVIFAPVLYYARHKSVQVQGSVTLKSLGMTGVRGSCILQHGPGLTVMAPLNFGTAQGQLSGISR